MMCVQMIQEVKTKMSLTHSDPDKGKKNGKNMHPIQA